MFVKGSPSEIYLQKKEIQAAIEAWINSHTRLGINVKVTACSVSTIRVTVDRTEGSANG